MAEWLAGPEYQTNYLLLVPRNHADSELNLPITNQTNVLASEVGALVPVGGVQEGALVLLNAWDGGPSPVVEDTACVDQDIAVLGQLGAILEVFDLHIIAALLLVPVCANYLMLCLDVFVEVVLAREGIEVAEDFLAAGVDGGPVKLWLKRPCVVVRWDITCAAVS